jgi:hypothetical protein
MLDELDTFLSTKLVGKFFNFSAILFAINMLLLTGFSLVAPPTSVFRTKDWIFLFDDLTRMLEKNFQVFKKKSLQL